MQDSKALAVRGVLAGAIAALIACTLYFFQVFEALEYQLYDRNIRASASQQAPPNIVIGVPPRGFRKRGVTSSTRSGS